MSFPWEKTSIFLVDLDFLLGFVVQTNSDHKTQKNQALKRYLSEKNLIHGRVMATISKFSPQTFETYFSTVFCFHFCNIMTNLFYLQLS